MAEGRLLVAAVVTEVKDATVLYPGCHQCYAKMLLDLQDNCWWCLRCQLCCHTEELAWRYRLSLIISDLASIRSVVIFGGTLEQHFGLPPKKFHRLTSSDRKAAEALPEALSAVFEGQHFLFGFRHGRATLSKRKQQFTLADLGPEDADLVALQMLSADGMPPSTTVCQVLQSLCLSEHWCQQNSDKMSSAGKCVTKYCGMQTLPCQAGENSRKNDAQIPVAVSNTHHNGGGGKPYLLTECRSEPFHVPSKGLTSSQHGLGLSFVQSQSQEKLKDETFVSMLALTCELEDVEATSHFISAEGVDIHPEIHRQRNSMELVYSGRSEQLLSEDAESDGSIVRRCSGRDVLMPLSNETDAWDTEAVEFSGTNICDEDEISRDADDASSDSCSHSFTRKSSSSRSCLDVLQSEEVEQTDGTLPDMEKCEERPLENCSSISVRTAKVLCGAKGDDELIQYKRHSSCGPLLFLPSSPDQKHSSSGSDRKTAGAFGHSPSRGNQISCVDEKRQFPSCGRGKTAAVNRQDVGVLCSKYLDMPESERFEDFLDKCFQSSLEESVTVKSLSYPTHSVKNHAALSQTHNSSADSVDKEGTAPESVTMGECKCVGDADQDENSSEDFPFCDTEVMLNYLDMPESEKLDEFMERIFQFSYEESLQTETPCRTLGNGELAVSCSKAAQQACPGSVQQTTVPSFILNTEVSCSRISDSTMALQSSCHGDSLPSASVGVCEFVRNADGCSQTLQNSSRKPLCSPASSGICKTPLPICDEREKRSSQSVLNSLDTNVAELFAPPAVKIRRCLSPPQLAKPCQSTGKFETAVIPQFFLDVEHKSDGTFDTGSGRQRGETSARKPSTSEIFLAGRTDSRMCASQEDLFLIQLPCSSSKLDASADLFDSPSTYLSDGLSAALGRSTETPAFPRCAALQQVLFPGTPCDRKMTSVTGDHMNMASNGKLDSPHIVPKLNRDMDTPARVSVKMESCSDFKLGKTHEEPSTCKIVPRGNSLLKGRACTGEGLTPLPTTRRSSHCESPSDASVWASQDLFSPNGGVEPLPADRNQHSLNMTVEELSPLCQGADQAAVRDVADFFPFNLRVRSSLSRRSFCLDHASVPDFQPAEFREKAADVDSPSLFSQSDLFASQGIPELTDARERDKSTNDVSGIPAFCTPARVLLSSCRSSHQCRLSRCKSKTLFTRREPFREVQLSSATPNILCCQDDDVEKLADPSYSMTGNLLLTSTPSHTVNSQVNVFSPDLF